MRRVLRNSTLLVLCSFFPLRVVAQESFEQGVQLFTSGQWAEARQYFESSVQSNPTHALAAFYLGRVFFAEKNYDQAVEWFEKAVQIDENNSDYHLWLGRGCGHKATRASPWKQIFLARKVKAHFEKAVELNPDNLAARLDLLEYYLKAPRLVGGSTEKARVQVAEIKKRDVQQGIAAEKMIDEVEGQDPFAENE